MDASENEKALYLRFVSGVYDEAGGTEDRPVDARLVAQKSLGSELELSVTSAEKGALSQMLSTCP